MTPPIENSRADSGRVSKSSLDSAARRFPPPNYFARGEQLRLFLLCSMLMLVLIMMNEARKPANWDWLWAGETAPQVDLESDPIDTKLDVTERSLPLDGFTTDIPDDVERIQRRSDYLPEITTELLRPIKDDTVMRAAENEAWLTFFTALKSRSAAELEALSTGEVGFAQLFRQTDVYRGRLVTMHGTTRRLESITPHENNHGITQLYRWVVQPDGSNLPVIVYSLEKPARIQTGNDLRERCTFTGLCFKRWAYEAGDGTRVAPLLLAKGPKWSPAATPPSPSLPAPSTLLIAAIVVIGVSVAVAVVVYRTANVTRPDIDRLRASQGDLDEDLNGETILPDVHKALGKLEDNTSEPSS